MEQTQVLGNLREDGVVTGKRRGRPVGQSDVLTIDEVPLVMAGPDKRSKQGARDYAVLLMIGNTPLRMGEIINLNTENLVDQGEKKYIVYRVLKKRKVRWNRVRLSNQVYDGLKKYVDLDCERTPSSSLFRTLGKHGPYEAVRITPKAISLIVQKYVDQAGIRKRITPHSFRATFTSIRQKVASPRSLQLIGDWKNINSVMPYLRETQDELDRVTLEFQFF